MSSRESGIALSVRGLRREFKVAGSVKRLVAVNSVSFDVNSGSVTGIVGESGSGKTTLGYCLAGYLRASSGEIGIGDDVSHDGRRMRGVPKVQMAFQDAFESLDPRWTVGQSLKEAAEAAGASDADVREALGSMGLDLSIQDLLPAQLSAGHQKVVNLARAVVAGARVIVADEPTSGLDLRSRRSMAAALHALSRDSGITLLLISHDLAFIQHLCDTVFVMYLGDVVEEGRAREVFNHPMHPYARALVAAAAREDSVKLSGEIPSPTDRIPGCPLAGRCPFAEERCWVEPQDLIGSELHRWACWKADRIEKEINQMTENEVHSE